MSRSGSGSPMAGGSATSLTGPANTAQEFNAKIKALQFAHRKIVSIASYVARGDRDTTIPRSRLAQGGSLSADPEFKSKDVTALSKDYVKALNTLKKDYGNARKRTSATGRTGQGFSNPKMYDQRLVTFFTNAKESIGQFDINQINALRSRDTQEAWQKEGGVGNFPAGLVDAATQPNPSSNYIVDQLSLVAGYRFADGNSMAGLASAGILTPLMCIYAVKNGMQGLAQPPAQTAQRLKENFLVKEAKKTAAFRGERSNAKKTGLVEPEVTAANYARYLTAEQIAAVTNNNSASAPWRNGQYLGATQQMMNDLTMQTFDVAAQKDAAKAAASDATLKPRDRVLQPVFGSGAEYARYFPFAALQVLTSINTVDDDRARAALAGQANYLTKDTAENAQLRAQLDRETKFLSAVLEYLNSPNLPGGVQKGKTNTAKRAKKRVKGYMEAQGR